MKSNQKAKTDIVWQDMDAKIDTRTDAKMAQQFDKLVQCQFQTDEDLTSPCPEAQQILDRWAEDCDVEFLPLWRAAVARHSPGLSIATSQSDGKMNDAEIIGENHEDLTTLMGKKLTFMKGDLYDQGDRRNTQAGDWNPNTFTWGEFLTAPWSPLTTHPEGKGKQGSAIVLGETIDGNRTAESVKTMEAIVIDIDSGPTVDSVIAKLEELDIFGIVYTSFNHNKTRVELKHDDVVRKLKLDDTPNRMQVLEYLKEHHKDRYDDDFMQGIQITEARHHGPKGLKIILETPPLHKFRVVLPLWETVELASLGTTASQWKDKWADIVTGFCVNVLGVSFDSTSCDVNRLFYVARHPKDGDWTSTVVLGRPVRVAEIEPHSKNAYIKNREPLNPFAMAGASHGGDRPRQCLAPSGMVLNAWHTKAKERFLITDVLLTEAGDKVRREVSDGKLEIECPFEHGHSTEGGTGTLAMSPHVNEHGVWSISCPHDACQGRHKFEYLEEMLKAGWFSEDCLTDPEFLIPDDDEEDVIEMRSDAIDEAIVKAGLNLDSPDKQICTFLSQYLTADAVTKNGLIAGIVSTTKLGRRQVQTLFKDLKKACAEDLLREEQQRRAHLKEPEYTPLEHATPESIYAAASAAKWLPPGMKHKNGWFGSMDYETQKFLPLVREFEVVYCADGSKGQTRTNQLTIRYQHRSEALGIVESTFRIGDTYKDSGTILGNLRNEGLDFAASAPTDSILTLLRAIKSEREAVYCAQSGWVTSERDIYVSPTGKTMKRESDSRLFVLDKVMRVSSETKGSLEQCKAAMQTAIRGKNGKLFLPGALLGPVGCLADFLNTEQAIIIANEGKKNSGKTTSLKAGVSFHAIAGVQGLMFSANATETAFEAMAMKASGAAMAPDDSGAAKRNADDEQRLIYQYANKMGRGRGTVTGGLQELNSWNGAMGISTERGLLTRLAAEGADTKSGVQSRVFTVDYANAIPLNRVQDAELLEAYDMLAHGGAYGVMWEPFVERLIEHGPKELGARVSSYEARWGVDVHGGERVVTIGALMAVASEICQEVGLFPANEGKLNVQMMLKGALDDTLEQRAGVLNTERQEIDDFRDAIQTALNNGQIISLKNTPSDSYKEVLGYFKGDDEAFTDEGNEHGISKKMLAREYIIPERTLPDLGIKIDASVLAKRLKDEGALIEPSERSKYYSKGLWESTPKEGGKMKSIRFTGDWVHGS